MYILPPYLKKRKTIGIICPSGYMPLEKMQACINTLHKWGYNTKIGKTAGHQFNYFSGTDEERLEDLQSMMDGKNIHAILCARGGYGLSRIIDKINFKKFRKKPKWIIGYSDVTVLHAQLLKLKIASLHAPMAAAFNNDDVNDKYIQSLQKALSGELMKYSCEGHALNKEGNATGRLTGGNLALVTHLLGTKSALNTKNKILFLEDVGEYLYNVDRMMMQLKRAGKLQSLAALIIGGFTEMKDTLIPFGQEVYHLIYDKVKEYDYPVCFNFPVGHTNANYALKLGIRHQLSVDKNSVTLREIRE